MVEPTKVNPRCRRSRLKIQAARLNARAFLAIQQEFGSFDRYIWQFVGGTPIKNSWRSLKELPARTVESDAMSRDLKMRGFTFVGSTICYAFMQAVGMVNDHTVGCFRYRSLVTRFRATTRPPEASGGRERSSAQARHSSRSL